MESARGALEPSMLRQPSARGLRATGGPALDLAPTILSTEMMSRFAAIEDDASRTELEQHLRGRVFVDQPSGATILLSRAAYKALTEEVTGSQRADEMALSIRRGVYGEMLASQHGLSGAQLVILDQRDGRFFAILMNGADEANSDVSSAQASDAPTATFLSRSARGDVTESAFSALPPLDGTGGGLSYRWNDALDRPCAVDGNEVVAVYDLAGERWQTVPLDEDIPAAYCDRIRATIKDCGKLLGIVRPDGTFAERGVQLLPTSSTASSIFMVVAGPGGSAFGLSPDRPYAGWVTSCFALLNQIDQDIESTMLSYGVRAIAGDIPPCDFTKEREKSWAATFNPDRGIIEINQNAESTVTGISNVMATLLLETRNIGFRRGRVSKLDANQGVDKGVFVRNWAETHRDRLGAATYDQIVYRANYTIAWYKKNLP